MEVRLDGKVAVVTGGSRGIGQATAQLMLASGAAGVVITSRKSDNLEQSKKEITASGADEDRLETIVARADDDDDARRAIAATIERFGSCDILVNNAGTNPAPGPLVSVDLGAVDKTWAVNQRGPLVWCQEAVTQWMADHGGSIVNVSSVGGLRPAPILGAYNISKAALAHFTHQLAFELAPVVRVNAVAPGVVKTRLAGSLWEGREEEASKGHPLGRLGEPDDVARAIVFLASDAASWITGVVLPVDGGVLGASGSAIS
ncbi:MAG TPA: SDR family oxidoreductase [Acidimicrobiia bacterium]|jgi:NAD(P)-dependent dehydrogenase (short-subunit alcohol dehydrogenase family)|nr:SDR family oxidoreductase [Acidimicrobiia bacterium]